MARSSARRLLGLLNDLLSFSRIEAGQLALLEVDFDARALVAQVLSWATLRKPRWSTLRILLETPNSVSRLTCKACRSISAFTPVAWSYTLKDSTAVISSGTITIDEALANADSPTNLSWLINNSEFGSTTGKEDRKSDVTLEFDSTSEGGTSFKEFTLSLADNDEETH